MWLQQARLGRSFTWDITYRCRTILFSFWINHCHMRPRNTCCIRNHRNQTGAHCVSRMVALTNPLHAAHFRATYAPKTCHCSRPRAGTFCKVFISASNINSTTLRRACVYNFVFAIIHTASLLTQMLRIEELRVVLACWRVTCRVMEVSEYMLLLSLVCWCSGISLNGYDINEYTHRGAWGPFL
jgi:hypothetical protein